MRRISSGALGLLALSFLVASSCEQGPPVVLAVPSPAEERAEVVPAPEAPPAPASQDENEPDNLEEQRARLIETIQRAMGLPEERVQVLRDVFALSPYLSQGNPQLTVHPMSRAECRKVRAEAGVRDPESPRCGAPFMAPLYNPAAGQREGDARVCIDRFEFPGIPCEYPVVYARANEAATLCRAVGKRLCDAHEWEGACAGALRPPEEEYAFDRDRLQATHKHNSTREIRWAYEGWRDPYRCATFGWRAAKCTGDWDRCGSYTYPAGSFPSCRSPFGVYDLHGNVAEHMNLPLAPGELASLGDGGVTEMKGSWFGFFGKLPHEDDCRWRAPDWHETRVLSPVSHRNYHLGFRCCKDVGGDSEAGAIQDIPSGEGVR
jgi:formylglycine-generating enzyme required for sulfatase activity